MSERKPKVLVLATSTRTRGGVSAVVNSHKTGSQWKTYHCKQIETHLDRGLAIKIYYAIVAFVKFAFIVPFYDLVHIHTSEPPSALRKLVFMTYAKAWRKKIVVHFHSFSAESTIDSKYSFLYKYLFNYADRVIVLSEYWKTAVSRKFPSANTQVIYNPCTIKPTSKEYTPTNTILFAGTINPRKGYDDLLRAFAKIYDRFPDWHVAFAGNGEIKKGKALAQSLGIEDNIKWLGWVNDKEKECAFREASIFCLPSHAEGFPMSVLDAWSYGLPVITTPVGGLAEVAIDGNNCLLFQPGDVDTLAACLERLISDSKLRSDISDQSMALSRSLFNIERINNEIGALYQELIG